MKQQILTRSFIGGIAQYQKTPHQTVFENASGRFVKYLNVHEDINYITQQAAPTKISGSTVTDLVRWIVDGSPWTTDRFFYGNNKRMYKENSSGTFSLISSGSTWDRGQGMSVYDNYLYVAVTESISRYGKLDSSPSEHASFLTDNGNSYNIDQTFSNSGSTYSLTNAISETATNRKSLIVSQEPYSAFGFYVAAKGTGDWTLTLHDQFNNTIFTKTIVNASMNNGSYQFDLSTVNGFYYTYPRMNIGEPYHVHLTSSNSTGTVQTSTLNDLETCFFESRFVLVPDDTYHPLVVHLNQLCIGNEHYIGTFDGATFEPCRIKLPPGYKVRTMTIWREYLVAGCWMGNSIEQVEKGRLYFWDGISDRYNYYKDCTVGMVNALHNAGDGLIGLYGLDGAIYKGSEPFQLVQDAPQLAKGKQVEFFPGAITEWQGQTYFGSGTTTDSTFNCGVYQYGSNNDSIPDSLVYAFPMSTGTINSTSAKIGAVAGFGNDLYIGWQDGSADGVDKVQRSSSASASGSWESMLIDNGNPAKQKLALRLVVTFLPLTTGQSVALKYKRDRASNWTTATTQSTVGETKVKYTFLNNRYKEFEYGFDLTSSSNTSIYVTSVLFEYDDLQEESDTE